MSIAGTIEHSANQALEEAANRNASKKDLNARLRETPAIFIRSGERKGEIVWIHTLPFRIGRGPHNHLQLADAALQHYHAVITRNAAGDYVVSAADEEGCPVFYRKLGRYTPQTIVTLKDKMYFQLGIGGPRLRFRFQGRVLAPPTETVDTRVQPMTLTDLGPADIKRGLTHLMTVSRLNESERLVIDEAIRSLSRLALFKGLLLLTAFALAGCIWLAFFLQARLVETRAEADTNQKNWSETWAGKFVEQEDEDAQGSVSSPEVELDPVTAQIRVVMETFGILNYQVEPFLLRRVKEEIDVEVQRLRRGDLDGFLERYNKYHPLIAAELQGTYKIPGQMAYLAWVVSDYRLDARSDKDSLGMWQFPLRTAERYGLIAEGGDYRQDFKESTRAAGELLTDLVTLFGIENFPLVAASYQAGEARVLKVWEEKRIWNVKDRTYEKLCPFGVAYNEGLLSEDTCRFPMRFLAAVIIGQNMNFHLRRE